MTAFVTNASVFGGILSACIEKRVHVQSNRVAHGMLTQRRGLQRASVSGGAWRVDGAMARWGRSISLCLS